MSHDPVLALQLDAAILFRGAQDERDRVENRQREPEMPRQMTALARLKARAIQAESLPFSLELHG